MARAPVAGEVKTRLESALGRAGALAAYEDLLARALETVRAAGMEAELWMSGDRAVCARVADSAGLEWRPQCSGDVGERMLAIIRSAATRARTAIVIGADLPSIDATYLRRAADALGRCDLVIGPAEDGGYGLIAMTRPCAALFKGIVWGGDRVYEDTLERARTHGLTVGSLPTVWDVDDPSGWERFRALDVG
jgi:rSAM/selenodomain-associated transferase 1